MDEDPRLRQPIVAVLGHVDHGRPASTGPFPVPPSSVMDREAGGHTAHRGDGDIR